MDARTGNNERASAPPVAIDEVIAEACEQVPGVQNGALVLLAESIAIGGIGASSAFDREPLVRAAVRCLGSSKALGRPSQKALEFVEYAFVSAQQITVIVRGKLQPRIALVLACTRESNLAFVLAAARHALGEIERTAEVLEFIA